MPEEGHNACQERESDRSHPVHFVAGCGGSTYRKGPQNGLKVGCTGLEPVAQRVGGDGYNPLWEEVWVTWKPGVKPVLVGQDTQIDKLEKQGKMTEQDAHIVLNAPILKTG